MEKRITKIYVYLMFGLFLLFTGFSGYSNVFTSKCILFTALSSIYLVASLIFGLSAKKMGAPEISALIYLGITALSAVASSHFPNTLIGISRYEGLLTIGLYVAVFLFVSQNWDTGDGFMYFLCAVMLLESVVVILQLFGFNILWLYPKGTNYYIALEKYNGAFISTVGNSDIASALFSLVTPVLWGIFATRRKYRLLSLASAVASSACLFCISVSAGIVAIVALICVIPFVLFPKRRITVAVILAFVAAIFFAILYFIPIKEGMLYELQSLMHGNYDPDFGSGRLHIWREVLDNIKPLLGTGPDTMLKESIEPFVKTINGKNVVRSIDIAHNDYLNILFHQGIFALVAYLGILAPLFVGWLKNGRRNKTAAVFGAGIFAYSVQVFFSYSACSSAVFFWIVLGMLNCELKSNTTSCADVDVPTLHRAV